MKFSVAMSFMEFTLRSSCMVVGFFVNMTLFINVWEAEG